MDHPCLNPCSRDPYKFKRRLGTCAALLTALSIGAALLPLSTAWAALPPGENTHIVGGWHVAAKDDPQVHAAAEFAVAKHAESSHRVLKLVSIIQAGQQIVAGTNYRLTMMVAGRHSEQKIVAKVWAKPDGSKELTSWLIKH